ncbi:hypothetical protein ACFP81_06495 [Deinococcus lacus]|uniref:DUF4359 domain-containing protein n=1 Tax=Deinococcus lacus TaxID=392561 RepID=A0ABW1YET4_9DEIO
MSESDKETTAYDSFEPPEDWKKAGMGTLLMLAIGGSMALFMDWQKARDLEPIKAVTAHFSPIDEKCYRWSEEDKRTCEFDTPLSYIETKELIERQFSIVKTSGNPPVDGGFGYASYYTSSGFDISFQGGEGRTTHMFIRDFFE